MTAASTWVETADREPPDGVLVRWTEGGQIVTGYRMGKSGGGLWLIPSRRGPTYCARPVRWRYAERVVAELADVA